MEFEIILKKIVFELEKKDVRYSLIGGFALGVLGISRTTIDLDFLVQKEDLQKLDSILHKMGYKLHFRSENVSHYRHKDLSFGSLDFIHAFRKVSLSMLKSAQNIKLPKAGISLKVLQPEDIIGLKLQGIANDSERKFKEFGDIEALMNLYRDKLDWVKMKQYFELFDMQDDFVNFKKRFGYVK